MGRLRELKAEIFVPVIETSDFLYGGGGLFEGNGIPQVILDEKDAEAVIVYLPEGTAERDTIHEYCHILLAQQHGHFHVLGDFYEGPVPMADLALAHRTAVDWYCEFEQLRWFDDDQKKAYWHEADLFRGTTLGTDPLFDLRRLFAEAQERMYRGKGLNSPSPFRRCRPDDPTVHAYCRLLGQILEHLGHRGIRVTWDADGVFQCVSPG